MEIHFDRKFEPHYGEPVLVGDGVHRLTADNPSPFTFFGTNSYIVGTHTLAVIDPGPDDDSHLASLLEAIAGRPVSHIVITHSHRDHCALASRLKQSTGALIASMGGRPRVEASLLQPRAQAHVASLLPDEPDIKLMEGTRVDGDGWRLLAVHTPGHASDHAALALEGTGILFSGDHVMGWSTTVVVPPDGSMSDYMASLDKLLDREDHLYLPGHGGAIHRPRHFVTGLRQYRRAREAAILERLVAGDRTVEDLVAALYRDKSPSLLPGAASVVLAHLEDLASRGLVRGDARSFPVAHFSLTGPGST